MALKFSDYDQRNYPVTDARQGYAKWAASYDKQLTGDLDIRLLERVTTVSWKACAVAADLACGTGRIGVWLRSQGVGAVDGIDLTPEMIGQAEQKESYRFLSLADVRETNLQAAAYDLVINVLCNEHLTEMGPLYAEAARLTRQGGAFVIVGYHPHFMLNGIPTHFRDENGANQAIESTIHLFSDHVVAGRTAGLTLTEMHERIVDEEWVGRMPNWSKHAGRPVSFAMIWRG